MKSDTPYNSSFYALHEKGMEHSARCIVPIVLSFFHCSSVIDLGCGTGIWLRAFCDNGVEDILGVDGDYVERDRLRIPQERFLAHDLKKPFIIDRDFDLAISLEVAEHIPEDYSIEFIKSLTELSPVVLFSAAIPGQGGTEHTNEQWPDYWAERFDRMGYLLIDCLRRQIWEKQEVDFWYRQNVLIFVRETELNKFPKLEEAYHPDALDFVRLVHPEMFLYQVNKARELNRIVEKKSVQLMLSFKDYIRRFERIVRFKPY